MSNMPDIPAFLDRRLTASLQSPVRLSETGAIFNPDIDYDEWQSLGEMLQRANRSVMWWIGDWLRFGEAKWGEKYAQAIETTGKSYQALRDAQWMAGRFELSRRRDNLSWSHHREVAVLDDVSADRLLNLAEQEGWSKRDLRQNVNRAKNTATLMAAEPADNTCTVADLYRLLDTGIRFGTIYADPPWLYDNQATRASTGNHYEGLTVEQLCALPVGELAAPDAHLHLWTTNGFLFDCPKIFEAWGFEFRSSFVWVKSQIGIGNYWRNSHEVLLTAIRGDAKRFTDKSLKSWLECDRGAHSAKPEQVRAFIEKASPGPYLELFGRRSAPGWAVWGNQIERTIFDAGLAEVA